MSKFKTLFTEPTAAPAVQPAKPTKKAKATGTTKAETKAPAPVITDRAKRNTPGLKQVSGFLTVETHKELRKALIDDERDFSELLQELVDGWLASRPK